VNDQAKPAVPRWHWAIAIAALLWNLMGCAAFATEVLAQEAMMESMTDVQKAWARSIPGWIYLVYAVAVASSVAGSIGLLLRKAWTVPLFGVCLAAVLVQMIYTMLVAGGLQAMGPSGAIMPGLVIVFAAALLWYAWFARGKGWLVA
jgi:hypothetical protein